MDYMDKLLPELLAIVDEYIVDIYCKDWYGDVVPYKNGQQINWYNVHEMQIRDGVILTVEGDQFNNNRMLVTGQVMFNGCDITLSDYARQRHYVKQSKSCSRKEADFQCLGRNGVKWYGRNDSLIYWPMFHTVIVYTTLILGEKDQFNHQINITGLVEMSGCKITMGAYVSYQDKSEDFTWDIINSLPNTAWDLTQLVQNPINPDYLSEIPDLIEIDR
jgi:hypothetical protein